MTDPAFKPDLRWIDECPSTQDQAWDLPPPASPEGVFLVARRQTAGRGRAPGRSWVSPPGGLYLSWRLSPPPAVPPSPYLSPPVPPRSDLLPSDLSPPVPPPSDLLPSDLSPLVPPRSDPLPSVLPPDLLSPVPPDSSGPAFPPPSAPVPWLDPAGFSLLGGLAVARALQHFFFQTGQDYPSLNSPWLKWPNDCWIGQAKIAGVLSDCRWQGNQCLGLVMGIGVNVAVPPDQLPENSTSLHLHVAPAPSLEQFCHQLVGELLQLLVVHRQRGLAGYLAQVRQLSMPPHTPIRYWLGDACHRDRVLGLDDQGFLRLESGQTLAAVDRLERIFKEPIS